MHKLASTPIALDCFETGDYHPDLPIPLEAGGDAEPAPVQIGEIAGNYIAALEALRRQFLATKDRRYWKELIRWLPQGWLQKRTMTLSYENLLAMCAQRRSHKLSEWRVDFINWARSLPYAQELIFLDELDNREEPA